jgi:hypothetical protein
MDLFVVPTIGFELLYAFGIVRLNRRDLVWINVTTNPTSEWVARRYTQVRSAKSSYAHRNTIEFRTPDSLVQQPIKRANG